MLRTEQSPRKKAVLNFQKCSEEVLLLLRMLKGDQLKHSLLLLKENLLQVVKEALLSIQPKKKHNLKLKKKLKPNV
jgi:hypothetical protein